VPVLLSLLNLFAAGVRCVVWELLWDCLRGLGEWRCQGCVWGQACAQGCRVRCGCVSVVYDSQLLPYRVSACVIQVCMLFLQVCARNPFTNQATWLFPDNTSTSFVGLQMPDGAAPPW
jgi:hypothetical protein